MDSVFAMIIWLKPTVPIFPRKAKVHNEKSPACVSAGLGFQVTTDFSRQS